MATKKTTSAKTVKKKTPAKATKSDVVKKEEKKEVKKTVKKPSEKKVSEVKKEVVKKVKKGVATLEFSGKYFYAVGKRKSSIAQVRIYEVGKEKKGIFVNGIEADKYFSVVKYAEEIKAPLTSVGLSDKFDISVKVSGGGVMGQAEAVRLGIARALVLYDENFKKTLKDAGYLTRDARVVERKKPGKRKARRSPQWAKR